MNQIKQIACRVEHLRAGKNTKDNEEMIYGLVPLEELEIFNSDPEGAPRVKEYVEKLLENIHLFAKDLSDKRTMWKVINKIKSREVLISKIKTTMPAYCDVLKKWEKDEMAKRNIQKD